MGYCSPNEYSQGVSETFTDGNGQLATVYLVASPDQLFICMRAQEGFFTNRFGRVYLDPQGDGSSYVYANKGDDAFQVDIPGDHPLQLRWQQTCQTAGRLTPAMDTFWSGQSTLGPSGFETVEWGLQLSGLGFGSNCKVFGLSVFHHWFNFVGNDFSWPAGSIFDQPRTWQLARILTGNCSSGDIAYVYRGNAADAASFYNLLTGNGYSVDLIPLASVVATDFSTYKMIIIADDTGSLDQWGTPTLTDAQVAQIKVANRPILGLGEGGYAFFGRLALYIGWPRGWHGPQNVIDMAPTAPAGFFNPPIPPVTHYAVPFNSVGIYLPPQPDLTRGCHSDRNGGSPR